MGNSDQSWVNLLLARGLNQYQLTRYLGGGEFGLVFEGRDTKSGKDVAVKVLSPAADGSETIEFEDEGRILNKLAGCSNVITLIGTSTAAIDLTSNGFTIHLPIKYHVLELAATSLANLLQDDDVRSNLPWPDRLALFRGAVKGVHQIHLRNCVHRDLKSSNCVVFLQPHNKLLCCVADFGRSRDLSEPARMAAQYYLAGRGDFRFAAPEYLFLQGKETPEGHRLGDYYGLGSLLFEIATGQAISAIALGYGPLLVEQSLRDLQAGRSIDLSGIVPRYQAAYEMFDSTLPSPIRQRAGSLIRQLCSPVPERRLPKLGTGGRLRRPGLEWLLTESDIMIKSLRTSVPSPRKAYTRGGVS